MGAGSTAYTRTYSDLMKQTERQNRSSDLFWPDTDKPFKGNSGPQDGANSSATHNNNIEIEFEN